MCIATAEDIAAFELLALELERAHAQRHADALERDRALRAVELELASAVSIVDALAGDSAAHALFDLREILETGHASRLSINEVGQVVDTSHERVEHSLETLAVAGFHWKWSERSKAAYTCETSYVPNSGGVLQHARVLVTFAHD
jgi:hypothetical protein